MRFTTNFLLRLVAGLSVCCGLITATPCGQWPRYGTTVVVVTVFVLLLAFDSDEKVGLWNATRLGLAGSSFIATLMILKYFIIGSLLVQKGRQVTYNGILLFEEGFLAELVMLPFVSVFYFTPAGILGGMASRIFLAGWHDLRRQRKVRGQDSKTLKSSETPPRER